MRVLLCGIAKCENHYIREWVEWYRKLGVDHICLFDNNDVDGEQFPDVIGDYIADGYVELVDFRGMKECQHKAYNTCYDQYGKEYDWLMFLDIDELLQIEDGDLKSFLSSPEYEAFEGIKVSWKCMTDNGLVLADGDYRMYDRLTEGTAIDNPHTKYAKMLVRGGLDVVYNRSVHHPDGLARVCDVYGNTATNKNKFAQPRWSKAVILHYRFKTIEEYVMNKMQRLYADHEDDWSAGKLNVEYFFEINERTNEKIAVANSLLTNSKMEVIRHNPKSRKPFCVFGVVTNEEGMNIREEMLKWLLPNYNLIEVQHDGSLYEQPALRFMQDFCKENKVSCLYIHTKGAYFKREETEEVREMWKQEFTKNKSLYFALVERPYACVATPFTGSDKTTWYNAFVANWQAMDEHAVIEPNTNRFKFERLFRFSKTNVIGVVRSDIERDANMTPSCRRTMHMLKEA